MKYKLIIKEEANQDIIDSYLFYESNSDGLGEKFLKHIEDYFKRITQNPKAFRYGKKPFREAFTHKFPFLIIYEIIENEIIVYALFHTSRDPDTKP